MRHAWLSAGVLLGLAAMCGGGCVHAENERLGLGTRAETDATGMRGGEPRARRSWRTGVVVVPIDGVVHGPTLRVEGGVGRGTDPLRVGAYPEPGVRGERGERARDAWVAIEELGRSVCDVAVMPLRACGALVGFTPDRARWSPGMVWKRTRSTDARAGTVGAREEAR